MAALRSNWIPSTKLLLCSCLFYCSWIVAHLKCVTRPSAAAVAVQPTTTGASFIPRRYLFICNHKRFTLQPPGGGNSTHLGLDCSTVWIKKLHRCKVALWKQQAKLFTDIRCFSQSAQMVKIHISNNNSNEQCCSHPCIPIETCLNSPCQTKCFQSNFIFQTVVLVMIADSETPSPWTLNMGFK